MERRLDSPLLIPTLFPPAATPMQLLVEVFSMDPVSGNTAFALCDLKVTYIGTMIKTEGGLALDPDQVEIVTTNSEKYDHVVSEGETNGLD